MIEPNMEPSKRVPSGFLIDAELIAAAIWEFKVAQLAPHDDAPLGERTEKRRPTYFLLILIELMLPGINGEEVLRILHHFALSPILCQLERSRMLADPETDREVFVAEHSL